MYNLNLANMQQQDPRQDPRFQTQMLQMQSQMLGQMQQTQPQMGGFNFQQQQRMNMMPQQRPMINDQFLMNSMQGGIQNMMGGGGMGGMRSQTDLRQSRMPQQRSPTPDMGQFQQMMGNSSAQSGKNFMQNPMQQTAGYTQPFAMYPNEAARPQSHHSGSAEMQFSGSHNFEQPMINQLGAGMQNQFMQNQMMMQGGGDMLTNSGMYASGQNFGGFNTMNNQQQQQMMQSQQNQQQFLPPQGAGGDQNLSYEQILQKMAQTIEEFDRNGNRFFSEFDAYFDRKFQVWELASMFEIPIQQARTIAKQIDRTFEACVPLKRICEELQNYMKGGKLDSLGFNASSEYGQRFKSSPQQGSFRKLAKFLKESAEFAPNSHSYYEVFQTIIKKTNGSGSNWVKKFALKDILNQKCAKILNTSEVDEFVNFIQITNQRNEISVVQFVNALRAIEIDFKVWDLNELLVYIRDLSTQTVQLDSLIERLRDYIFSRALNFEETFSKRSTLKIKTIKGGSEECECVKVSELNKFLDREQALGFSVKEKEKIVKTYQVELMFDPGAAKLKDGLNTSKGSSSLATTVVNEAVLANLINNQSPAPSAITPPLASSATPPPQQIIAPSDSQSQLPNFQLADQSNDSINRGELSNSQSGNLPKMPPPTSLVPEKVNEEDYEEWDDDERIEEDIDLKEGGQREVGARYLNYQKLLSDLKPTQEMLDSSLTQARRLKFEILESIKGWIVLSGESILNSFKGGDRKGTLLATKRQIKVFLQKVLSPKPASDALADTMTHFFMQVNEQGLTCIDYKQFYNFFHQYANLKQLMPSDPNFKALDPFRNLPKVKSLASLMQITNSNTRFKHEPIDVDYALFFQMMEREKSKILTRNQQREQKTTQNTDLLMTLMGSTKPNQISLVKYQELIGFPREEEPLFIQGVSFRQVCIKLQMSQTTIKQCHTTLGKIKNLPKFLQLMNQLLMLDMNDFQDQQLFQVLYTMVLEYSTGSSINSSKFLGRLEFENNKLWQLQRFYLELKIRAKKQKIELSDIFQEYGADMSLREMTREQFEAMLTDLQLVAAFDKQDLRLQEIRSQELSYFIDEYDQDDSHIVNVKRLEEDFDEFVGSTNTDSVFDRISDYIMKCMATYCIQVHQEDIYKTLKEAQAVNKRHEQLNIENQEWLHSYDFVTWFHDMVMIRFFQQNYDTELIQLFTQFIGIEIGRKNVLNIPLFIKKIVEVQPQLKSKSLDLQIVKNQAKKLKTRIVEVLEYMQRSPFDYFRGVQANDYEFEQMLSAKEFQIQSVELTSTIQEIIEYFKGQDSYVQVQKFCEELNELLRIRELKMNHFKQMHRQLNQKGTSIQEAINMVKGKILMAASSGFLMEDFISLCKGYDLKADIEGVLKPIMSTFETNEFGEVTVDDFVDDFNQIFTRKQPAFMKQSTLGLAGDQIIKGTQVVATRYFDSVEHLMDSIANDIMSRNLTDFGSYLKGHDYKDQGLIANSDFFQVIEKMFPQCGKGDILDLIECFDPQNTGVINIVTVADALNRRLRSCFVMLRSHVSDLVDEAIVEPITPRKVTLKQSRPDNFNTVFLDLLAGLLCRKQGTMSDWFNMFGRQQEGYMSFIEFRAALDKTDVQGPQETKFQLFEYLKSHQEHEFSHSLVMISQLFTEISKDFPRHDLDTVINEVLRKVAVHLQDSQIPVRDSCKKYETHEGSGEILYSDFTFALLADEWKLKNLLTRNMLDLLQAKYNPTQAQNVPFEPLIMSLQMIEQEQNLKLSMTQQEVDEAHAHETGITYVKTFVAPKTEPIYEFRSKKNTYFDSIEFGVSPLTDPFHLKCCDDILLETRQRGCSVEQHFQKYGVFSKHDGERHIDIGEFREALMNLGFQWAFTSDIVKSLFKGIEQVFNQFNGLTLEMIGGAVFMNSSVNLLEEENQVLDLVYKQIKDQGLINSITDVINFINFERDGTTSLHEFEKLLIDTFKIKDKIPRNRVNLLCQRYRVRGSSNKKQVVMHYHFMQDLAYKHIGIGIINQWAARVSENIVKQIQTKIMLDTAGQGMTDDEVENEIKNFFVRSSMQGGQLQFSYTDCTRAFKSLHLVKEQVDDSHKMMDDFFKFCSQLNPSLNTIPPIDITHVDLPSQIEFNQVLQAVLRLAKKPVTGLYSDVMDLVYVSSKKRHVSISGPYLLHLFKEDDRSNSGVIPFDLFVNRVQEKILGKPGDVSKADTTFLATKYLSQFTLQSGQYTKQVSYNLFMNDYYYYETGHIGECINLLLAAGNKQRQQELIQKMSSPKDNVKGIEDLPKEQQAIFVKMGKYLLSKDLDEFLCGELVNRDQARCGFLSKDDIKAAVKRVGIPISEKQVTELTQVVSVDIKNKYNYLELIAYLLGVRYMQRLQTENNIWPDRDQIQVPKVDLQTLHLTQSLIEQLELKLANLRYLANEGQKGSQFLKVDQLFILFRLSQIAVSSKDHDTLQTYLNQTKDPAGNININHLLSHFKVNESPAALLTDIQRQLKGKDLKTIFTSAQQLLTFGDFKNCLMKQNVNLPKTNEVLQKLFNLISDQKSEVSRHTLERIIEFEPNPQSSRGTKEVPSTEKKLPTPPAAFIEFVKFLIKNDFNMMSEFSDCVQAKRIPEQRFSQYLEKIKFQTKTMTEKQQMLAFFQEKDGQLNFPKLVTYIRQDHPTYGKQIPQINPQVNKAQLLTKAKQTIATLPHDIKQILHKLCSQVRQAGLKPDQLMTELDLNKDGCVKFDEFDSYCVTNQLSIGLSKESVTRLFKYIDANNDGHLSIQELSQLIDQTNLVFEDLMSQFSQQFEQELIVEIRELFDKLDQDKNKYLSADELMIVMKQTRGHQITVEQARGVIDEITQDTHGKITKEQFVKYLLPRQKQQLLTMDDSMEDIRELFGKYSSTKGGFGGELFLNKQQLKKLIIEAGYSGVQDTEVDQLFIEIDQNSSGHIDKDEFMAYMYVGDKVQLKSRDTLLRIRKAHMKLNVGSVFDMIRLIPKFTTLSFTQSKLESEKTHRPSQSLMPTYDYKVMKYRALAKVKEFKSVPVKEFISRFKPDQSMECSIVEICGVPNLSSAAVGMVAHLEVRYFLFDQDRKVAQSSIQISSAKLVPLKDRSKPAISQAWSVPDALRSLIVRGNDQWSLVIELVSIDEKDSSKQITVGWTSTPIKQTKLGKLKLPLHGGSPFNSTQQEIITQENDIKPKSGFFKQLQSAKIPVVERYITLDVKPFDKIEETTQAQICILPENQICWKQMMGFAQAFRCYSYNQLIKDEITMQNPKSDLILSKFSKIYDCPDVQKALCEFWNQICPPKTPLDAQIQIMTRTVTRIYGLQYDSIMKMDSVYPTRTSMGALAVKRHEELQKCILQENPKLMDKLAKAVVQKVNAEIVFMEEYTPFTATELDDVGNQVGLDKENERRQDELESMYIKMGLKL